MGIKRSVHIGLRILKLDCLFTFCNSRKVVIQICRHRDKFFCLLCLCMVAEIFLVSRKNGMKKKHDQYNSIFDANNLIVDQNTQYNKILSEDFTLGFVKYLIESTKT